MEYLRWPVFLIIGFLSFVPVIRLYQYKSYKRYKSLRYFVTGIFAWTIFSFLIHLMDIMSIVYYLVLLIYPLVFLIAYLGYETIQSFIEKKTPKYVKYLAYGFFSINLIVALTNPIHRLYLDKGVLEANNKIELFSAQMGVFFYIHTTFSYIFMILVVIKLLIHLRKPTDNIPTIVPFIMVLTSVVIGFIINAVHVFIYSFYVDPTYLFFVVFTFFLYIIIFRKDFRFALLSTSRKVLIDAMREMYVISDEFGNIVEYSIDFKTKYHFSDDDLITLEGFMRKLNQQAIIYKTFNLVKDLPYEVEKKYLYTVMKEFKIPGFKPKGQLILFYDETRLMALVDSLNYLRNYDQMTNIYNRNYLEENTKKYELEYPNFGVMTLDLNGLKLTNDYLGHKAGDELIIRFTKRLVDYFKDEKVTIARYGGDEIIVIDYFSSFNRLTKFKNDILKINEHKEIEKHISVSIGYSVRMGDDSFETVLKRADKELYKMKNETTKTYQEAYLKYLEQQNKKGNFI